MFNIIKITILSLCTLSLSNSWAGGPLNVGGSDGVTPFSYANGGANITIHYDQGNLGSRYSNTQADALVTTSIDLWNNVTTATVNLSQGSDIAADVIPSNYSTYANNYSDGVNPIIYDTDGSIIDSIMGSGAKNSILGFAGSAYYTSTGEYVEGKAVINGYYPDTHPSFSDAKLIVVLTHELGHFIGLDHTQLDNSQNLSSDNYPLMYPQAYRSVASLHEDDISSVSSLYPTANIGTTFSTITGVFHNNSSSPIIGANIWVNETTTGKVYSVVSDYKKQNTGYFSILVPAGTYNLNAESISTSFTGGSSVGPYSESLSQASFLSPHPITPVVFGAPDNLTITSDCNINVTFKLDGSGTLNQSTCAPIATYGNVSFSTSKATYNESTGTISISVLRNSSTTGDISVDYTTVENGLAVAGVDFTAKIGTLNWLEGDSSSKTISISLLNDVIFESLESFGVQISNPVGTELGNISSTVVNVQDDDAYVGFVDSNYSVTESGGSITLTLSRIGDSSGAISVNYATVADTAVNSNDFTSASGTISWADGDSANKTITISITNDSTNEYTETFDVNLSNASGTTINIGSAKVFISDDDEKSSLFMSLLDTSAYEGDGTVSIVVKRIGSSGAVSVDYSITAGSALATSDYTDTSGTLNWSDGDTANKTILVTLVDDVTKELTETFTVQLSNPVGTTTGSATTKVYLRDDDAFVTINSYEYVVNEGDGTVAITIARVGSNVGAISVDYAFVAGSATAGNDYTNATGTLNWADGDSTNKTITITITDNTTREQTETFDVQISNPVGTTTGNASAKVYITDDDSSVTLLTTEYVVNEGDGTATINVSRVGGSGGAISVDYSITAGTALVTSDYVNASGTLNWADGDATDKSITITLVDDSVREPTETFTVNILNPSGTIISNSSTNVYLKDDDSFVMINSYEYIVYEGDGTATITVSRIGGNGGAISVDYALVAGTATAGNEYVNTSGTLNWADGDSASKTITITLIDDSTRENTKTFNVQISNPVGTSLGNASSKVYFKDDDSLLVMWTPETNVIESDGTATITVSRVGGSTGAVSVDYAFVAGSATAVNDYIYATGTLNWADGDAIDKVITVTLVDDYTKEYNESFTVVLSNPVGITTANTVASVYIQDNDSTVTIPTAEYSVFENSGTVVITVSRYGGSTGAISVDYSTVQSAGAVAGSDYTAISGTLNWADGDSADKTITVTLINDGTKEYTETFTVDLSNPVGTAINKSSAKIFVRNDD